MKQLWVDFTNPDKYLLLLLGVCTVYPQRFHCTCDNLSRYPPLLKLGQTLMTGANSLHSELRTFLIRVGHDRAAKKTFRLQVGDALKWLRRIVKGSIWIFHLKNEISKGTVRFFFSLSLSVCSWLFGLTLIIHAQLVWPADAHCMHAFKESNTFTSLLTDQSINQSMSLFQSFKETICLPHQHRLHRSQLRKNRHPCMTDVSLTILLTCQPECRVSAMSAAWGDCGLRHRRAAFLKRQTRADVRVSCSTATR